MADSDSEIEFNRQLNNQDMENDRPDTDTEEQDQEHENVMRERAASVLPSLDDPPELVNFPPQPPRSRRALDHADRTTVCFEP